MHNEAQTQGVLSAEKLAVLRTIADAQPYRLLFATVSGAHLYGFPSPDSDFDLRGVHLLPLADVVGLGEPRETIEASRIEQGLELDLVTHDALKFLRLLLRKNGYVLEQLLSPLVVVSSPAHEELVALASGCVTRFHAYHYLGFAETQWKLFAKESPRRVKPLLYVFRVLLTGIHLMQSGEVEANLVQLNQRFRLPYIDELVARKLAGPEQSTLAESDFAHYEREYERLRGELERAFAESTLPEMPRCRDELNELLVRLRLGR